MPNLPSNRLGQIDLQWCKLLKLRLSKHRCLASYFKYYICAIIVSLTGLLSLTGCEPRIPEGLSPGNLAPQFSSQLIRPDLNGQPTSIALKDLKGQVVLLNFWASWCAPCLLELESLEKLYQANKSKQFTVLAVAIDDTTSEVERVIAEYKLTFPIVLDNSGKLKSKYQISGFPETVFLNRKGQISMVNDEQAGLVNKIKGERDWFSDFNKKLVSDLLNIA